MSGGDPPDGPKPGTCVACGGSAHPTYALGPYCYLRCHRCSTLQLAEIPSTEALEAVYQADESWTSAKGPYLDDRAAGETDTRRRVGALRRLGFRLGRVFELGPGRGYLARELARQGCHVSVCEKHLGTRQELRRAGLDVVDEPEDAAGEFDTVIPWGVVEHLPDPPRTLASLRRLIAPDGAFAILTEDASCWAARVFGRRWGWLLPPEHTVLFSHQGLEFCLQSVGYGLDDYLRWPTDVRAVMNSLLGRARSQQYRTRFRAERHALTQRAADRSFRAWFVQLAKRGLDTQLWPLSEHKLYRFSRVQR